MTTEQLSAKQIQSEQAAFMTKIYGWMTIALLITAAVSMFVSTSEVILGIIYDNIMVFWGLVVVEFLCVGALSSWAKKMSSGVATTVFMLYAILNGLTLSFIFLIYTSASIVSTFFVTAGTFAIMSIYGYYTQKDLTSIGNLAFMGLIGVVLASIANLFFASSALYWAVTYAGIFVFIGLIAYDTQKLKEMHLEQLEGNALHQNAAILGALTLYLDFINLFILLLRVLGGRD